MDRQFVYVASNAPISIALASGIIFVVVSFALLPQTTPARTERVIDFDDPNVAYPCQNVIVSTNGSGTFYTCPHASEISNAVFDLPAPVYKKVACTSTYGCSQAYRYVEIVPPNLLSEQQMQAVIDKAMSLPETRLNSGWTLDHFIIQPREDRWIGHVQLFIDGIKQLPPSQECGWYGQIELDLETLEIRGVSNIPPRSDVKCNSEPKIELTLNGLKDTYKVGEVIYVSATQKGGDCAMQGIVILDENRQTVLVSKNDAPILCPVLIGEDRAGFSLTWTPHNHGEPIIINQTGTYTLVAEFETEKAEHEFTIVNDTE